MVVIHTTYIFASTTWRMAPKTVSPFILALSQFPASDPRKSDLPISTLFLKMGLRGSAAKFRQFRVASLTPCHAMLSLLQLNEVHYRH